MEEQKEKSSEPPPATCITIQCGGAVDCTWLEKKVDATVAFLQLEAELSVCIVDDEAMTTLHEKHSGVAGTTDVLTFEHDSDENKIDVDIAVCLDVAVRAAKDRDHSVESELLLYIVHGILHCTGFDDHNDEDHARMHKEEDRVLQAIGVGAIWSNGS